MNKKYPPLAFAGCFLIQLPLWYRAYFEPILKDRIFADSYHWQNIAFIAIALLLVAPIFRHGSLWQRIGVLLLCILPVIFLIGYFQYSLGLGSYSIFRWLRPAF
jgi:hypothetical protein